jgi:hypothetical protein
MLDIKQEIAEQTIVLDELKDQLGTETDHKKRRRLMLDMDNSMSIILYLLKQNQKKVLLEIERVEQRLNHLEEHIMDELNDV